jgi:hypothetical protein
VASHRAVDQYDLAAAVLDLDRAANGVTATGFYDARVRYGGHDSGTNECDGSRRQVSSDLNDGDLICVDEKPG